MRDLTEEELALAPEWATHYFIDTSDDTPIYESKNLCWWAGLGKPLPCKRMDEGAIAIIRKPFDIAQHEWSDKLARVMFLPEANKICFEGEIYKKDAIAIAKALGVTAEDLK